MLTSVSLPSYCSHTVRPNHYPVPIQRSHLGPGSSIGLFQGKLDYHLYIVLCVPAFLGILMVLNTEYIMSSIKIQNIVTKIIVSKIVSLALFLSFVHCSVV